ncbi:transposase [Nonomuraea spiralis]|uniref:transposase n=1 Tax=Nonomuraea spiralis TaxID=46182 RepID=UPI0037A936E9
MRPLVIVGVQPVDQEQGPRSRAIISDRRALATCHNTQIVIAQQQVEATSNEIPALTPLLSGLDLTGVVITADALHTQQEHTRQIAAASGHHLFIVKSNQPTLPHRLKTLLWHEAILNDRTDETSHGHRSIEAPHHIRDVTYREDTSRVRTDTAPAPHPASWPACAIWPSAWPACSAGPTSPPPPTTTAATPPTDSNYSVSQHENAFPLPPRQGQPDAVRPVGLCFEGALTSSLCGST